MKKCLVYLLLTALCVAGLSACSGGDTTEQTGPSELSFAASLDFSAIKRLDGKQVTITGYMATLSPINGKYMYLMNMPYQSCPFCVPNTTQLANTMAVYAKDGQTFTFTDQAIKVLGTLRVGNYTDDYGYVYNYRVENATYEIVDLSSVSAEYAIWRSVAQDGVVAEINSMFDYLYFLSQWTQYQSSYTDDNGENVTFFLYPGDVSNYLADDGPYGYASFAAEDYFTKLVARIRAVNATELEDLVKIVENAAEAVAYARGELDAENYTYDEAADQFTLTNNQKLIDAYAECYRAFSTWLGKWEL